MPRVSLILPTIPGDPRPDASVPALRSALEGPGLEVEILIVFGPGSDRDAARLAADEGGWKAVRARDPGLASAAMAGLEASSGSILILLDPRMGYAMEALARLAAPLLDGRTEMVVGSRYLEGSGPLGRAVGRIAKTLTGSTDPLSGLVGLSRPALDAAALSFRAVGAKYSLEFLSKVSGRRMDVPASVSGRTRGDLPGWDDLRHLKRLADHRFGNASRLLQFCFVGASGVVVDLTCYALFQKILGGTVLARYVVPPTRVNLALAVAAGMSVAVALVWNFSLNRRLTFSYARRGSILRQFAAYAASNLLGVMVSLAFRLLLPRKVAFFNDHKLAAAIVGIVAATGISFSMSRWVVFRRRPGDGEGVEIRRQVDEPRTGPHLSRSTAAIEGAV